MVRKDLLHQPKVLQKKRKVIDQVPYDEPSEDEEQEEVPATSSAPAEKKILKKVEQKGNVHINKVKCSNTN